MAKTILQADSRASGVIDFTGLDVPWELEAWNSCDWSSLAHYSEISIRAMAAPFHAHHFPAVLRASNYFSSLPKDF